MLWMKLHFLLYDNVSAIASIETKLAFGVLLASTSITSSEDSAFTINLFLTFQYLSFARLLIVRQFFYVRHFSSNFVITFAK